MWQTYLYNEKWEYEITITDEVEVPAEKLLNWNKS